MSRIVLVGATGHIGARILEEALERGLSVTAIARAPEKLAPRDRLKVVKGDALIPAGFADTLRGADALVSALAPDFADPRPFVEANMALAAAVAEYKVGRLVVVGGASTLTNADGIRLFDAGVFPAEWKPYLQAHVDTLAFLKTTDIDWSYFSPAMNIAAGERTGKYRLGETSLVTDSKGQSSISYEDYAVALVDELEARRQLRKHFTAAY